ncbi:MAG TPA: OstA-like protein [Vicinamibacterales bacterium]|nr:OstA-like protein [Vicinamibacterales bacterium]
MLRAIVLVSFALLAVPRLADAQPPSTDEIYSDRREIFNEKNQHHIGHVELKNKDTTIYADDAWFYPDEDRFVATGNVTFSQGNNRISAEKADFNTKTHLGVFTNASGIATIQPPRQAPSPTGVAVPPVPGQQLIVYFFGDEVQKIGPKKYRITNGGFTTCVQPTPRWDLHSDTVILNLEHYTFLKNAVLTAKGVPMLYLPVLWYPTKSGDRATGFLIPTYGSSSILGQSLHNAFFWAIDRSQDATITHEWYSKVGQGVGAEYRYNFGRTADGNLWTHFLDQHEATYTDETTGLPITTGAAKDFEVRGAANQLLPGNIRLRANANYFSNIESAQTFNTNIYDASRNQRAYGVNAVGAWSSWTMNATYDTTEYFYDLSNSSVTGDGPRIDLNRNERPLFGSQVYFSLMSEYANLVRNTRTFDPATTDLLTETNLGVNRIDVWPQIRYPFKKWQWFTVNTTASWRDTYYTRSAVIDPETGQPSFTETSPNSINRQYFSVQSQIVGPVFNRIWDTPDNGYAEKFKHSIEPYLTVQETSSIDNFDQILKTDGVDSIAGGTNLTYGVVNRFFAKRKLTPGQPATAREIVDVEVSQSYYTNQLQAQYDLNYQTSQYGGGTPSHFSPYALSVRAMPTNAVNATVRAEFDPRYNVLKTMSANGSYALTGILQTQAGWSKYGCVQQLLFAGQTCDQVESQNVNGSVNAHTRDNHWGTVYNLNFDVTHSALTMQQITGFYNAQCCGIAFQYQTYNYGAASSIPVPADRRFFLSFTLAGLGAFSPFNGALSGVPR